MSPRCPPRYDADEILSTSVIALPTKLDDTSPQFTYTSASNGWINNHTGDLVAPQYYHGTFHGTYTNGDTLTFTFNGTAVYMYGAKRPNHGLFSAQLDDGNLEFLYSYADPSLINQVLFSAAGLPDDNEHTVQMVALPSQSTPSGNATYVLWFDFDYAVVTTASTGKVYSTVYDDTSTYITYGGEGWTAGPPLTPQNYHNTTAHISQTAGDSFSLQFNGSSIQVFGGLYVDHGNYTVSLDGVGQGLYIGTYYKLQTQVPLFTASNLTDGPHQILVTNVGQGPRGNFIDFDYALVNSTIDPHPSRIGNSTGTDTTASTTIAGGSTSASATSADSSGSSGTSGSKGGSNAGGIAGGVVGGLVALAIIGVLSWFFLRRRQRNRDRDRQYVDHSAEPVNFTGDEVKPYPHGSSEEAYAATMGGGNTQGWVRNSAGQTSPSARETDQTTTPFLTSLPPPPASNATSYPRSVNPPSSVGNTSPIQENAEYVSPFSSTGGPRSPPNQSYHPTPPGSSMTSGTDGLGSTTGSTIGDTAPPATMPPPRGPAKAAGVAVPFTARPPNPSSTSGSTEFSTRQRLQRDGREFDMGPVIRPEHDEPNLHPSLPPDYQQATEPLPGQRPLPNPRFGSS